MADMSSVAFVGPATAAPTQTLRNVIGGSAFRAAGRTSRHGWPAWEANAAAAAASFAGLAVGARGRRSQRSALRSLPTVDRAKTKQFRRELTKSDSYFKFGRTQMNGAMENLKKVSGSELLTKIRQNGFKLTVGDITFVLAESYGFCWGVERAVAMAYEARDFFPDKNIWVTNEIIHNPSVNKQLSDKGMKFVQTNSDGSKDYSGVQEGDVVILPAFGASVDEMALFKEKNVQIVDTTCPWVSKVWTSVEKSKDKGHTAIIHGKYDHEETVATKSFAQKYLVLKNMGEAEYVADYILGNGNKEEFLSKFSKAMSEGFDPDVDLECLGVANQTTMLKGETELIGKLFERTLIKKYGPQNINEHFLSFNTICDATQERQDAMYKMFGAEYEAPESKLYADLEGEQVGIDLMTTKNAEKLSSRQMEADSKGGTGQVQTPAQQQLEPRACGMEDASKSNADEDLANPEESSLDSFASHAATWAKQCLAFRSSKTWSPTRLCCPANVFLGSVNGTPSPPPADAPACVLRLTGHGLRCLQRFHEKQGLHSMTFQSQAEASQTPGDMLPQEPPLDCDLNMQDYKVRGLDCMKMWPWMRDLPTSVWAGHGWAFDENGLRRLSSSGGSHAMQGVEVFESVGVAAEQVKPSNEKIRDTPIAVAAEEHPPPLAEGQKPSRFKRINVAKQSGIPNVQWKSSKQAWEVNFDKLDSKGKMIGKTGRVFSVKNFMGPGISEAQADAAALEAAKAFRAELVEKGILSEPKPRDPNFTSEVPGVRWHKNCKKWRVEITAKGGKKKIQGGLFTEKAAAEAKALELMEKDGLQRRVKPVATLANRYAGLPVFHPKVPYPRVIWSQAEQQWHACCNVGGSTRSFRVKPKDHSEAELERSFQVAVAWKKNQEKEKERNRKAVKSKVKPGRKQRK